MLTCMILSSTAMEMTLMAFDEDLLGIIMTSLMLCMRQLRQETIFILKHGKRKDLRENSRDTV